MFTKEKEEFNHRSFSFPSSSKKFGLQPSTTKTCLFLQCWCGCECVFVFELLIFLCLNYVSHVQSRLVSVNGFRLMVFDFVVVVVVYLWLIGLVKKFSLYISRFWFVLTLDDNFSLFFDDSTLQIHVALFRLKYIYRKVRFTNILQLFSLQFLHFRLSHRLFTNCKFLCRGCSI